MKIIHAIWEKRNLNIDCNEIIIEPHDTIDTLKEKAIEYETEYIVMKVPTEMTDISLYLQTYGYTFIETITSCYHEAKLPNLTQVQQRIVDSVSCEEMNSKDKEEMFNEIRHGMFKDNRIAVDPHFTKAQANNRYFGWITDETNHGAQLFKLVYKNDNIGFFILRNSKKNIFTASLGGIYPKYQQYGFGLCMNYYEVHEGIKQNAKKIFTSFSSNNRGAFAIHLAMSYILDEQYYVFIRHK